MKEIDLNFKRALLAIPPEDWDLPQGLTMEQIDFMLGWKSAVEDIAMGMRGDSMRILQRASWQRMRAEPQFYNWHLGFYQAVDVAFGG